MVGSQGMGGGGQEPEAGCFVFCNKDSLKHQLCSGLSLAEGIPSSGWLAGLPQNAHSPWSGRDPVY